MKKVKDLMKDILIFVSFFILSIIISLIINPFLKNASEQTQMIASVLIVTVLSIYLFIIYHKKIINDFNNFKKENIINNIKVYVTSLFIMYVLNIALAVVIQGIATNEAANREILSNFPIISVIQMVLIAPFYEEILFRLNFKNLFKNKITFSLITGILFGAAHVIGAGSLIQYLYILPYSVMGFGLGYMFYDTDNIFTSLLFHMFNNSSIIVLLCLTGAI